MNTKLEQYRNYLRGKKIAVLGIGVSNTPLIRFLIESGAEVTACDIKEKEQIKQYIDKLNDLPVKYQLGQGYMNGLENYDIIFKTPVIRHDLPELQKAVNAGAILTSEMEVFFELCPARIFAVTGSDGKTTTTTLIYKILQEEGYNCWLGGNIGNPLLSHVGEMKETDMVVVELSSFQLQTMTKSPDVAVITNISPNHLDVHKSYEEYIEAKKNICRYQDFEGRVVLNYDNDVTRKIAESAPGKVVFFSRLTEGKDFEAGAFLKDGYLTYRGSDFMSTVNNMAAETSIVKSDQILIPGAHNIENYLAAIGAVAPYVHPESIAKVARTFKGVEHRIELVRELNGIKFYNNSIGTSPSRTIAALNAFPQRVILIAGGKDKKIPFDSLGPVMLEKVKKLVLVGETSEAIFNSLRKAIDNEKAAGRTLEYDIPVVRCTTFEEAVNAAYEGAQPGDQILLSPASTSFDMFRNFEEKGNRFKELVNMLK